MFNPNKQVEGTNEIKLHNFRVSKVFLRQFKNPLLIILLIAVGFSFLLGQKIDTLVISLMMSLSIILGFWNEYSAEKTVSDLLKKISLTATVIRNGTKEVIPVKNIILGDIVLLFTGSIVPADIKLTASENLELNEAILTGEAMPVAKSPTDTNAYMGTVVVSGSGQGEVVAIGTLTKFGQISLDVSEARPETDFQVGLRKFGLLLVRIVSIMAIVIFFGNWAIGRPVVNSLLFALTIAIGLTPELLPVIVTVSLSHGARKLAKSGVIVKQLVSIEDLGNMEVLCTDKTGTLTEGQIKLVSYFNNQDKTDERILEMALICNSAVVAHKIIGDAIDSAIWNYARLASFNITRKFKKIEEEPFNYEERGMFTVISEEGKNTLIYKGSPLAVIDKCKMLAKQKLKLSNEFLEYSKNGVRVIALATRPVNKKENYEYNDAVNMKFEGYICFKDVPKKEAKEAILNLAKLGVALKIVTGDNEEITKAICKEIGANLQSVLVGPDIDKMDDVTLSELAWKTDIFARVTPKQKGRIIRALNTGSHTVGYLGDGVNDALALHDADVGISVDSAVDVAKDTASIVLSKKNLEVIAEGIKQGRITFSNTMKYILMGTSSNFGNMFSAAGASFILPFLPMLPSQVLLTNFLYDISQLSLPTDSVDPEQIIRPKHWDLNLIKRYMLFFGPISSIYDFLTFAMMYFLFKARGSLFQTGWFIESVITEIMVIFVIRTVRSPFYKSRPSNALLFTTFFAVIVGISLPFTPLAFYLGFTPLPIPYFILLIFLTISYLVLVEIGKVYLNKRLMLNGQSA